MKILKVFKKILIKFGKFSRKFEIFPTIDSHSFSSKNFIVELKISLQSRQYLRGADYIEKHSSKEGGCPPAADPMDTCSSVRSVRSTCTLINRISVVSLWVSVLYSSLHIDYHVLILYKYVYRDNQRLCDWENDT